MTTTEELLATFEGLAISQRKQADRIVSYAAAINLPLGDLSETVDYLREQADVCEAAAQAIRDGEAGSIDDFANGGIGGPFFDAQGNEL